MYAELSAIKKLRLVLLELMIYCKKGTEPCHIACGCSVCMSESTLLATEGFEDPPERGEPMPAPKEENRGDFGESVNPKREDDNIIQEYKREILSLREKLAERGASLQEKLSAVQAENERMSEELNHKTKQWNLAQKTIAQIKGTIELVSL